MPSRTLEPTFSTHNLHLFCHRLLMCLVAGFPNLIVRHSSRSSNPLRYGATATLLGEHVLASVLLNSRSGGEWDPRFKVQGKIQGESHNPCRD